MRNLHTNTPRLGRVMAASDTPFSTAAFEKRMGRIWKSVCSVVFEKSESSGFDLGWFGLWVCAFFWKCRLENGGRLLVFCKISCRECVVIFHVVTIIASSWRSGMLRGLLIVTMMIQAADMARV